MKTDVLKSTNVDITWNDDFTNELKEVMWDWLKKIISSLLKNDKNKRYTNRLNDEWKIDERSWNPSVWIESWAIRYDFIFKWNTLICIKDWTKLTKTLDITEDLQKKYEKTLLTIRYDWKTNRELFATDALKVELKEFLADIIK